MFKRNVLAVSLSLGLAAFAGQASADVVGGGASLSAGVFNDIITGESYDYESYVSVGSSAGKRAFFNNDSSEFGYDPLLVPTVHYAGSDSVASSTEISNYAANDESSFGPLIQVPFAGTSVTVPFNNSDVTAMNPLVLSSSDVAEIFSGQITNWNQLGSFPSKQITVVHRADGSGTVEIFTRHLATVEPTLFQTSTNFLTARIGTPSGSAVFQSANGSSGVVSLMNSIDGAITFVSPDYVDPSDPAEVASIVNRNDSTAYLPTQVNVQATFASVTPPSTTNPADWAPVFPDPSAGYPIAGFTFMLLSQCYSDNTIGTEIGDFMLNHYTGFHDSYVSNADLVPLPSSWQNAVLNTYALFIDDATDCAGIGR
ncbi:putative binding protein component of ABC transporter [Alcanivorax sp. S71-1-4]|uniref:substrate-binding domain-containing protein n=1 Tax=Alcanivorax sp. S71-1-4 TaxID=1177159 RepID=UPI001359ECDE|nr:substrate-binding domain-containing protein [Alcanivorax sp. S71-1-4]KAF0809522.1 putative binding protein component of ABC transporter [Alcanivorax sp. S71-1-4]